MLTNTTPSTTEYYVIHSEPDPEHGTCAITLLIELGPGENLGTGQPHTEQFASYDEALARAVGLGYQPQPTEIVDEPYGTAQNAL